MLHENDKTDIVTGVKRKRRYWRRLQSASRWSPIGLIPLFGLVVLFLFGAMITAPQIEAEVRWKVYENLRESDVTISGLSGSGQNITIMANAAYDSNYIHRLARSTRCETWIGQLTCSNSVKVNITAESEPAVLERRPHQFIVFKAYDEVILTGEVPNRLEHNRILRIAEQRFQHFKDELKISQEAATEHYPQATSQALAVASHLVSGQAAWSDDVFTVSGVADAKEIASARTQFDRFGRGSGRGGFNVQAVDYSLHCNEGFQILLRSSTIRFRTGSAQIDDGNDAFLRRLAEQARECPGTLIIEGHTDSQGDAAINEALSLARASAVRDALSNLGVDAGKLRAIGFGESRPIADNTTASGRNKNRRISIVSYEPN